MTQYALNRTIFPAQWLNDSVTQYEETNKNKLKTETSFYNEVARHRRPWVSFMVPARFVLYGNVESWKDLRIYTILLQIAHVSSAGWGKLGGACPDVSEDFTLTMGAPVTDVWTQVPRLWAQCSTTELSCYPIALYKWANPLSHSALHLSYPAIP